jgi:hypothetical protein
MRYISGYVMCSAAISLNVYNYTVLNVSYRQNSLTDNIAKLLTLADFPYNLADAFNYSFLLLLQIMSPIKM